MSTESDCNDNLGVFTENGTSPPILTVAVNLLSFLRSQTKPLTEREIHSKVPGRRAYKLAALRFLLVDGTILKSGEGKHGRPFEYKASQVGSTAGEYQPEEKLDVPNQPWVPGTDKSFPISETITLSNVTMHPIKTKKPASGMAEVVSTACHSHSADRVELLQDLSLASRPAIAQPPKTRGSALSRRK